MNCFSSRALSRRSLIRSLRLVAISWLLTPVTAIAGTPISEQGPADADGQVNIDNVSGSVRVRAWDKTEVQVTGELGNGAELVFRAEGDHTRIEVRRREGVRRMKATHLVLSLPQGSDLSVSGVSAELDIRGMHGPQRLETVSGDIETEAAAAELDVATVSGDVHIVGRGESARVEVTGVSGNLQVEDVGGEIRLQSVSGKLRVQAGVLERLNTNTTSGAIDLALELAAGGRLLSETVSGDVELDLVRTGDIEVDVESFSGSIDNCLGEASERKQKYGPGRYLRFQRGAADRTIRIETLSGDVELCGSDVH